MTSRVRTLLTLAILAAAVAASLGGLVIGQQFTTVQVEVGGPSPETFTVGAPFVIEDAEGTEQARRAAAEAAPPVYGRDEGIETLVIQNIRTFFESVREATAVPDAEPLPVVTTTTAAAAPETSAAVTTVPPAPRGGGG